MLRLSEAQDVVDVSVEILGLLGNLTPRDMPAALSWGALAEGSRGDGELLHTLELRLIASPETTIEDDLVLEAVLVVGAMALDPAAAASLASSAIPARVADVLISRAGDPDIALQSLVALNRLLVSPVARDVLVNDTRAPAAVAAMLAHPHPGIATEADDAVSVMIEHDRNVGDGASTPWYATLGASFSPSV